MKPTPWFRLLVFVLCLFPFFRLIWGLWADNLGANPVEFITTTTGSWALNFLMITLAVTPVRKLLGFASLIKFRRMFGLLAFAYAAVHFMTYVLLDHFFDFGAILEDVIKRPFITVGFTSFVLLIPLAVTSSRRMIQKLGGRRWQWLHRLVYLCGIGGVVHYLWLVKADRREPLIYAAILTVLLGYRLVSGLVAAWQNRTRNVAYNRVGSTLSRS